MQRPNHSYLVVNGVTTANTIINLDELGKPSRAIFEFKVNEPTVQNCKQVPEQIFNGSDLQTTTFVKRKQAILTNNKWAKGALFVCSFCSYNTDVVGNI
jgi:hypothetical protein